MTTVETSGKRRERNNNRGLRYECRNFHKPQRKERSVDEQIK
jgi:hypothetical protein